MKKYSYFQLINIAVMILVALLIVLSSAFAQDAQYIRKAAVKGLTRFVIHKGGCYLAYCYAEKGDTIQVVSGMETTSIAAVSAGWMRFVSDPSYWSENGELIVNGVGWLVCPTFVIKLRKNGKS
jgi:hypothetical protein